MATVNLHEAQTTLSSLVDKAARSEETVICKSGKPMARLVPLEATVLTERYRKLGGNALGITYIAPDFEDALWTDDELEEMELS